MKDWWKLIVAVIMCLMVGYIGSLATYPAIPTWFATLNKPIFSPPNWLFAPVWTALYILMGISLYLVWVKGTKIKRNKEAINLFLIQLGLNFLWSFIFFGFRNPSLAFLEIIALWILLLMTILRFWKISKIAAYLLMPYIAWISFASILNLAIVLLN